MPTTAVLLGVLLALSGGPAGAAARVLLGRLRRGARIPPPWCEAGVAAAWGSTGAAVGSGAVPVAWLPALLGLGWFAVAVAAVDVARRRLPDALTLPAVPLALLLVAPLGAAAVHRAVGGALLAFGAHALVHLAAPAALGAGDVKLAAPLGAVLGASSWAALAPAGLLAALLAAAVAVVVLARSARRGGPGWRTPLPHGPPMAAAAWLVALAAAAGAGRA
jgi:leader peptidase (prepilin peptidase) / N-methyltransferase